MTTIPTTGARATLDEFEALFDALLFAVSHDLKSPLLSISLGVELLESAPVVESVPDDRAQLALDAVRRGAEDLTRQLDAVTIVSRARRRPLDATPVALSPLLPEHAGVDGVRVAVDARVINEFVAAFDGAQPHARVADGDVRLSLPWPTTAPTCEGPPLEALLASLSTHAGTVVATLAGLQVQLERQGGTIVIGGGSATALLPRR